VREFGGVFLLMAGVFGLFGVVFAAVGGIRWYMTRQWVRTSGELVLGFGLPVGPIYRWRDHIGREHQRWSWMRAGPGTALQAAWRRSSSSGQWVPVTVRYDPRAPHRGVLDTPTHRGVVFAITGVVALVIAVGLLIVGLSIRFRP